MKIEPVLNEEKESSSDHFISVQEKSPKRDEPSQACPNPKNTGQARIASTRHTGVPNDFFMT